MIVPSCGTKPVTRGKLKTCIEKRGAINFRENLMENTIIRKGKKLTFCSKTTISDILAWVNSHLTEDQIPKLEGRSD